MTGHPIPPGFRRRPGALAQLESLFSTLSVSTTYTRPTAIRGALGRVERLLLPSVDKDRQLMTPQRIYPRFNLQHIVARTDAFEASVLDISRAGMRIESSVDLEVGKELDFEVGDHNHQLDVAGNVRWIRRAAISDEGGIYRSGVQFEHILTADDEGVWARLVAENGRAERPAARRPGTSSNSYRVPLLTTLSPEDGTVVRHQAVTVIGQVRDPGLGAMIEVNGVRALVYGRRFEARVPLIEGANLVRATVSTSRVAVCRSPAVRVTRAQA